MVRGDALLIFVDSCFCCFLTGIGYDSAMIEHSCICGKQDLHPEQPERIASIYRRLRDTGLLARTTVVRARQCTLDELRLVHTDAHLRAWAGLDERQRRSESDSAPAAAAADSERPLVHLACGGVGPDADTFFNAKLTPAAARTAVGLVVDLALKIAAGELRNAFAIVRPPGAPLDLTNVLEYCVLCAVIFSSLAPDSSTAAEHRIRT